MMSPFGLPQQIRSPAFLTFGTFANQTYPWHTQVTNAEGGQFSMQGRALVRPQHYWLWCQTPISYEDN